MLAREQELKQKEYEEAQLAQSFTKRERNSVDLRRFLKE
jgi:hypothetical protein